MTSSRTSTDAAAPIDVFGIANALFRLTVLPGLGGSITQLVWTPPGRPEFDLMRRATPDDIASGNPSRLASFAMVPFTNRIDAGLLPLTDDSGARDVLRVPINRPAQNAAIHGFGRLAAWTVVSSESDQLLLTQTFAEAGHPYIYEAEQEFLLTPNHVACRLSVTNRGPRALPFGIGFHPWFDRTPAARLTFTAKHAFRMDERDMPLEAIPAAVVTGSSGTAAEHDFVVAARTPFDTPISGWSGSATITWPERGTALDIAASGAFRLIHIFSPNTPDVFCVEPVSHLPDVVNRRHLAAHGDMTRLAPGQSMQGVMTLTPRSLK